jgi:hypothetical protein
VILVRDRSGVRAAVVAAIQAGRGKGEQQHASTVRFRGVETEEEAKGERGAGSCRTPRGAAGGQ